jgi:hypothetical protein
MPGISQNPPSSAAHGHPCSCTRHRVCAWCLELVDVDDLSVSERVRIREQYAALVDEHSMMEAALREIERWPVPIDGGKVRAVASAAIERLA